MPDFPENVVAELKVSLEALATFDVILKRPLKPVDPNNSCGVYAVDWVPQEYAMGQFDPAISRYLFGIQTFVKHGNEQEGIELHAQHAKKVRVMLYRDTDLRVRLGQLSTIEAGVTERAQKWGVQHQRYISNEINNNFLFLAVTEFWLETEMV